MTGALIVAVIVLAAGLVLAPFLRRRPDCRPPADRLFQERWQAERRKAWERWHEGPERTPVLIGEDPDNYLYGMCRGERVKTNFGRN